MNDHNACFKSMLHLSKGREQQQGDQLIIQSKALSIAGDLPLCTSSSQVGHAPLTLCERSEIRGGNVEGVLYAKQVAKSGKFKQIN